MRKVLAIVLALVMAFGCTAIAFAADWTCPYCASKFAEADKKTHLDHCDKNPEYKCQWCHYGFKAENEKNTHETKCEENPSNTTTAKAEATQYANTCQYCGNTFNSEAAYNDHIAICYNQNAGKTENLFNITITDILDKLFEAFKVNNDWIAAVSGILTRIMDLIEKIGTSLVGKADVAGAIDDLEAKVAELPIVGDVLEYIHNLITTLKQKVKDLYAHDAETAAVAPVDTGSTSVGIAAFACVSVAAAAAYVCTKKKEN